MAKKRLFSNAQILILGFLIVVVLGSLLLALPVATREGVATPFVDCIFTATSATCVTGLVVEVTSSYWSIFGQIVILVLIQIGGIGFMTFVTLIMFFIKGQVGLFGRKMFMESAGIMNLGSVFILFKQILLGTLIIEGVGATILSFVFVQDYGAYGIYLAIFHSISAFCNAGFDLLGEQSLMPYQSNPIVILTIALLIIVGGLGFIVWNNILDNKFKFKKFNLHTKIVLVTTSILILVPTALFMLFDWNYSLEGMNFGNKLMSSLFQVVSPRTAGFYSVNLPEMSDSSYILSILLMLIGGSTGSTAGGIKTTTFAILIFSVFAEVRKNDNITIGKRKLPSGIAKSASSILTIYIMTIISAAVAICAVEQSFAVKDVFYECVSAICTVGLSLGITPELGVISKIIITLLMFIGRVGSISFALAFGEKKDNPPLDLPTERIMIG